MGAVLAGPASASQLLARNAAHPAIKVGMLNGREVALVTYQTAGVWHRALLWGAMNARFYSTTVPQVQFSVNYNGGAGSPFGANAWSKVVHANKCAPDQALKSSMDVTVAACTMTTNPKEHWALQEWQRTLPDAGVHPKTTTARAWELHVSHWTDSFMPVLWLKWGWANAAGGVHYDHLYGVFSVDGHRVYGHASTSLGNPTDGYGRNIYVDAVNSAWTQDGAYTQGGGWVRWNAFLTHYPHGDFCASVYKTNYGVTRPGYASSTMFRATAMGPGVTPIVRWQGPPPGTYASGGFGSDGYSSSPVFGGAFVRGPYDALFAQDLNDEQRAIAGPADSCYKVYGPK
jgi:hypothetical protein